MTKRHYIREALYQKQFVLVALSIAINIACNGDNDSKNNSKSEEQSEFLESLETQYTEEKTAIEEPERKTDILEESLGYDAAEEVPDSSLDQTADGKDASEVVSSDEAIELEHHEESIQDMDIAASCGNNILEPGEECDGSTRKCITSNGNQGIQACSPYCDKFFACVSTKLPDNGSPYPKSPILSGISFDRNSLVQAAPGSDQFGLTVASNNNVYLAYGDGGGFGGTNSVGRVSLGVARIEGLPPNWTPHNVWGGVNPESSQKTILGKANGGIIALGTTLYLNVAEQGVWSNSTRWKSSDLGITWVKVGPLFNEPNWAFAGCGILQFGPGYSGNRDNYVYGYDSSAFKNGIAMFRVKVSRIENRGDYEFFSGFDSNGNPTWNQDISKIRPVFQDPKGTEWGVTAVYHPYIRRYLLSVRHNGDSGEWGLFDSTEPWGPWTTVAYGPDFPDWTYTPDPNGASSNRPAYMHQFPQTWMHQDSMVLWHISDRGDQFNLMKAMLHLVGP